MKPPSYSQINTVRKTGFIFTYLESFWNGKKRIYHRSPMQTEKFQPKDERMMPETRFTEFPALSVDPRVGISLMFDYFSYL